MSSSKQTQKNEKDLRKQIEAALEEAARQAKSGKPVYQSGRYKTA